MEKHRVAPIGILPIILVATFVLWWVCGRAATGAERRQFVDRINATHGAQAAYCLQRDLLGIPEASLGRVWWAYMARRNGRCPGAARAIAASDEGGAVEADK